MIKTGVPNTTKPTKERQKDRSKVEAITLFAFIQQTQSRSHEGCISKS